MKTITILTLAFALTGSVLTAPAHAAVTPKAPAIHVKAEDTMTTTFKGVEVNVGTVSFMEKDGKRILKLSPDFVIPKAPAPSWQVVDSEGNVYLLKQLRIAGKKTNTMITLPDYIKNVAKVQIWCSFAEVNLGEATFSQPVGMMAGN